MRLLLLLLAFAATSTVHLSAQTVVTVSYPVVASGNARQQDIAVPAGKVFKLLSWSPSVYGPSSLKVDGVDAPVASSPTADVLAPHLAPNFVVAGPRTLSLVVPIHLSLVCSYTLVDNGNVAGPVTPSAAVVIPADAAGPVQIIMESSTDLVTWTAAQPGTYGSSTAKRFFRLRAVGQ